MRGTRERARRSPRSARPAPWSDLSFVARFARFPTPGQSGRDLAQMRDVSAQHLSEESDGAQRTSDVAPTPPTAIADPTAPSRFKVAAGFNGVDALDNENANGFDLEPPDQGLCVGHGKVMEVVNDALAAYDTSGTLLANPIDLNSFYGYAPGYDTK